MTAHQWLALVILCAFFGSIFFTFGRYYQATHSRRVARNAWLTGNDQEVDRELEYTKRALLPDCCIKQLGNAVNAGAKTWCDGTGQRPHSDRYFLADGSWHYAQPGQEPPTTLRSNNDNTK